ncbi:hypothetical protein [Streptomyces sp. CRN 30]|uniref:hypothetical protein n=1 Tax=Streptomyces sp. CRN 30 TaxID=3075613 RepID=UPI002A838465|nr:hypothetical protein [Streptomyces sp. CRN 30]
MTDRPTDAELLAELQPLLAVIADTVHRVPVRLGPGGAADLITDLTLACAVYVGRHVLPADAAALASPPWPIETDWVTEVQRRTGKWQRYGAAIDDRAEAREYYDDVVRRNGSRYPYRLVREITTYTVEATHTPEQP